MTTDAQGRYIFPENRLDPGEYALSIRAVGYDIGAPTKATVAPEKTADGRHQAQEGQESRQPAHQRRVDDEHPRHRRPEGDAAQLPVGCHTLERIVRSTHDSDEWTQVITRMMGYGAVSQPIKPQRMLDPDRAGPRPSNTARWPTISRPSI